MLRVRSLQETQPLLGQLKLTSQRKLQLIQEWMNWSKRTSMTFHARVLSGPNLATSPVCVRKALPSQSKRFLRRACPVHVHVVGAHR